MEWIPEVKYWMDKQIKTLDEMTKAGQIIGGKCVSDFIIIWFNNFQWAAIGAYQEYDENPNPCIEDGFNLEMLWNLAMVGLVEEAIFLKQKEKYNAYNDRLR